MVLRTAGRQLTRPEKLKALRGTVMIRLYICWLSTLVFAGLFSYPASGQSNDAKLREEAEGTNTSQRERAIELIEKSIAARHIIREGEFEFRVVSTTDPNKAPTETRYRVLVKDRKLRSHRWIQNFEFINCFGCYGEDFVSLIGVMDSKNPGELLPLLTLRSGELVSPQSETELEPDPRLIGMIPRSYRTALERVQDFFSKTSQEFKVTTGELNGEQCERIDFKVPNGDVSYWISTEKDYSVIQCRFAPYDHYENLVTSSISFSPNLQIWFPEKIVFQETKEGQTISREELTVVVAASKPIDNSAFTIEGLGCVKPGTAIRWSIPNQKPPADEPLVWDGTKIVSAKDFSEGGSKAPLLTNSLPESGAIGKRIFINLSVIGIVLGGWMVWQYSGVRLRFQRRKGNEK
jgi:hypothetical protein